MVDPVTGPNDFKPCKVLLRKFRIFKGSSSKVVVGHGVGTTECNRYPVFEKSSTPMQVCHSLVEMDDLDYTIEGYYLFRWLREGEAMNNEPEKVEDIDKSLLFKVYIGEFRLGLAEGQEFVKNPLF